MNADEYEALGELGHRIELVDGDLWGLPGLSVPHQGISYLLHAALHRPARSANLKTFEAVNLRLATGEVVRPDLVVVAPTVRLGSMIDAADAVGVAEIHAPGGRALHRAAGYAAARIEWYLIVTPDNSDYTAVTVQLLRRQGAEYVETTVARPGETLLLDKPFPVEIKTDDLVDF